MELVNWYWLVSCIVGLYGVISLKKLFDRRGKASKLVAVVTRRRKLKDRLVRLVGYDKAIEFAQDEAKRLQVSSASFEALEAALKRAEKSTGRIVKN